MKNTFPFISALLVLLLISCNSRNKVTECTPSTINGTTTYWDEYLGHDETVDFWPDKYVNYWAVEVDKKKFPNIGFKIQGEFPNARYFSYNVYKTDRNSTASLFDTQIKPEVCSTNPFKSVPLENSTDNKQDAKINKNLYTLFVVPESNSEFDSEDNVLKFKDKEDKITLVLRYYAPEENDQAGVPLPTLEVFDLDTKEPVTIPATNNILTVTPQTLARINVAYAFQIDSKVRFYRGDATGLYPNNDNQYVRTFLNYNNDDVYMIRWKSPKVPTSKEEYEGAEVRYTSMNFGDNLTKNFDGIYDREYNVDTNGFVTLVLAAENSKLRKKAEDAGYTFMPWSKKVKKGYLVYRHLLPLKTDAPYSINKVPLPDFANNPSHVITHDAKNYIGDYAPYGQRMTQAEYLANFGGFNN